MNREKWESKQEEHARNAVRKRAELNGPQSAVTWLDPPVMVGRLRIVGVCSDASAETKAVYL